MIHAAARLLDATDLFPTAFDRDFFTRVYTTPMERYTARLDAIGFGGHARVLDAGCGYGQWALALAGMNDQVDAIDVAPFRTNCVARLAETTNHENLRVQAAPLETLPFADGTFDRVFCYGAVFLTDWRVSLGELVRVLRPGGVLYVNANSWGWYLYNLLESHKASADFSPRRGAAATFAATLQYYGGRSYQRGWQLIIPPSVMRSALARHGCRDIRWGAEASLGAASSEGIEPFFAGKKYGLTSVYEVLATRADTAVTP